MHSHLWCVNGDHLLSNAPRAAAQPCGQTSTKERLATRNLLWDEKLTSRHADRCHLCRANAMRATGVRDQPSKDELPVRPERGAAVAQLRE